MARADRPAGLSPDAHLPVCPESELGPGQRRIVVAPGRELLVLNCGGELYAIENRCSHEDAPLDDGAVDEVLGVPARRDRGLRTGASRAALVASRATPWVHVGFRLCDALPKRCPDSCPQPPKLQLPLSLRHKNIPCWRDFLIEPTGRLELPTPSLRVSGRGCGRLRAFRFFLLLDSFYQLRRILICGCFRPSRCPNVAHGDR